MNEEKRIIQVIISVFETGKADGDPTACTILPDGAGISYGLHQATDRADSLDRIVLLYLDSGGRAEAAEVLKLLQADASTRYSSLRGAPADVQRAVSLLRDLGRDPVMVEAQRSVFDSEYWDPAMKMAAEMGLKTALARAIVYDTCIHSGPGGVARIRARFPELPPARGGDEHRWAAAYVAARRAWLAGMGGIVSKTVYRMDAFSALIAAGNWALTPPFTVRGVTVR